MSKDGQQRIFVCCSLLVLKALFNERLEMKVEEREMSVQRCADLQVGSKRRAEELSDPIFKVTKVVRQSSPLDRSPAPQPLGLSQPKSPAAISNASPNFPVHLPEATELVHASPIAPTEQLTPPVEEPADTAQQSPAVAESKVKDVDTARPVITLPSLSSIVSSAHSSHSSEQPIAAAPVLPALVPRLSAKFPPPRCRPRNSLRQGKVATFETLIIEKELALQHTAPAFPANYFRAVQE